MEHLIRETKNYNTMIEKPPFWLASDKINGLFGHVERSTSLVSREGITFPGFEHIEKEVKNLMSKDSRITHVQGELYTSDFPFQTLQGIIRGTDPTYKTQVKFHIFNIGGVGDAKEMARIITEYVSSYEYLIPVKFYQINDCDVQIHLANAVMRGFEGLVFRTIHKTATLMHQHTYFKVKGYKECDLKIVGYEEGNGHIKDMLGKFCCEGNVDGQPIKVKIGTGFKKSGCSDSRQELWKIRDQKIGCTLEALYDYVSEPDENGIASLMLARFGKLKEDR